MSPLAATLKLDVTVQARSKLYSIGIAVAVVLGLLGRTLIGSEYAAVGVPTLYLLGLGGTTYFFGASMVLMDKTEGTLAALRVTPLKTSHYLLSKLLTLTAFAATEGLIVQAVGFWGVAFDPLPLIVGVILLGSINTLLGLGQIAPHDSVLQFLIPGALVVGSVSQWPFLGPLGIGPTWLYYLIPTNAPYVLMLGAFEPLETWQWAYGIGGSIVSVGAFWWWANRRFNRYIRLGGS